ncbi:uncharacterized protein LOC129000686 [Macrosteles quadrilineatus]|uniref:uncharacterized protein LOC129000686 n=1 Tax=Macrosteles quadrilineatus TaxID=74068 RepID=UPI0023E2E42E|nr:uncharacterized protein LOC129000686 [Macrosteles quadrilineatus]
MQEMNFKTKNVTLYPTDDIEEQLRRKEEKVLKEMEEFQSKGSGWTLSKIINIELRINRYVPLRGSSYIDLPTPLKLKKAIINIQNNDYKCFLWSVLAAIHPVGFNENPHRVHNYRQYEHEFDSVLQGIEFPMDLNNVKLFEKRSGISINVYSYDEKFTVYPLLTTNEEKELHVDLLYLKDGSNSHYCLINDLCRLVRSQKTKHKNSIWLCRRCLLHFGTEDLLEMHKEYCKKHEPVKIIMPNEGEVLKFKDYNRSMRVPFTIYADFECMLSPIQSTSKEEEDMAGSYTKKYQKHDAISFSYYIVNEEHNYGTPVTYFGEDAPRMFVDRMLEETKKIRHLYSKEAVKPIILSEENLNTISMATQCHICGGEFTTQDPLVRDHDHLSGKFRGPAHNSCNLNFKKPSFIPIFIHNLSGYDTHIFIKMFGLNNETIDVIPNNEERYISYTIHVKGGIDLRFVDSLKFMSSSLGELVKNLTPSQFKHTSKYYSGKQLQLLLQKGVYPYDAMDSLDKYERTSLLPKTDFYNKLTMSEIKEEDYQHASEIWRTFDIKNMKEYTLLYNKSDVLQLADVMENFRNVCMQTYKLDPAWYYTAPGLAWSAMFKTTRIELELLTDYNMILMIGNGIRGGLSQVSNRYAAANNKYMDENNYDKDTPSSYLTYLDANNLYGWAMCQHMPYAEFKWVEDAHLIDVTKVPDDSDIGYILEVDLEYPKELHDLHSDFPLAPERQVPPGSRQEKLLATLYDKEKYVTHYRNLKQYVSLGLKVKKIHRAISFKQKNWLKPYIDLNTNKRTSATNQFDKDFYKLMNNSVFGKTMENVRNRVDVRLATKEKQVDKWLAQPNFKRRTIFTNQLAALHMSKTKLLFNKPIYLGMSILDISKTLMYDFHYNVIKARYKDKAQLQYTDTDSLTYHIQTEDFYDDMKKMIDYFDTSDYPPNHPCFSTANKKVIGKFKDELKGKIMYEHAGLRSKMYASRSEDEHLVKKFKGITKSVVENTISFQDYKDCLKTRVDRYCKMNMIRSYKHDLYSVELNKIALSANDNKRYILSNGISSLPWGHSKIPQEEFVEIEEEESLSTD